MEFLKQHFDVMKIKMKIASNEPCPGGNPIKKLLTFYELVKRLPSFDRKKLASRKQNKSRYIATCS